MSEIDRQATLDRITNQLAGAPIVLYMKGSPERPQCGFSARVVEILLQYDYKFAFVNILENPDIRRYLPEHPSSEWPTFPQLFVKGQLVGGCDIVSEHHEQGELEGILAQSKNVVAEKSDSEVSETEDKSRGA